MRKYSDLTPEEKQKLHDIRRNIFSCVVLDTARTANLFGEYGITTKELPGLRELVNNPDLIIHFRDVLPNASNARYYIEELVHLVR